MEVRVLILAPHGRDSAVALDLLQKRGIVAHVCGTIEELVGQIEQGAGAVLVTEEAIARGNAAPLVAWVDAQPTWSDLPFVVLANGSARPRSPAESERLDALGNMLLLERPLHADALLGGIRSALKARRMRPPRGAARARKR